MGDQKSTVKYRAPGVRPPEAGKPEAGKFRTTSVRLPEATIEGLQGLSLLRDVPVSELFRQALDAFLAQANGNLAQELADADRRRRQFVSSAAAKVKSAAQVAGRTDEEDGDA